MDICAKKRTFISELKLLLVKSEKNLILEKREADFLRIFDTMVKSYRERNILFKTTDICKDVAKQPAPCFYVTTEQALHQYRLYRKGQSNIKSIERRKMFAEIFTRFEYIMNMSQGSLYQYAAMDIVLSQEAPCFYLNDTSAVLFYYKARRNKRNKIKNKW